MKECHTVEKMRHTRDWLTVFVCTTAVVCQGWASDSLAAEETVSQLPRMEVTETAPDSSLTSPTIEEAKEELRSIPGGTSLIDSTEYLSGEVLSPADAFRFTPGVFAQSRNGYGQLRFLIRGSGIAAPFE